MGCLQKKKDRVESGRRKNEGTVGIKDFTVGLQARVTAEMNARLVCRFEECEMD
jgi:hypothetical protein